MRKYDYCRWSQLPQKWLGEGCVEKGGEWLKMYSGESESISVRTGPDKMLSGMLWQVAVISVQEQWPSMWQIWRGYWGDSWGVKAWDLKYLIWNANWDNHYGCNMEGRILEKEQLKSVIYYQSMKNAELRTNLGWALVWSPAIRKTPELPSCRKSGNGKNLSVILRWKEIILWEEFHSITDWDSSKKNFIIKGTLPTLFSCFYVDQHSFVY